MSLPGGAPDRLVVSAGPSRFHRGKGDVSLRLISNKVGFRTGELREPANTTTPGYAPRHCLRWGNELTKDTARAERTQKDIVDYLYDVFVFERDTRIEMQCQHMAPEKIDRQMVREARAEGAWIRALKELRDAA